MILSSQQTGYLPFPFLLIYFNTLVGVSVYIRRMNLNPPLPFLEHTAIAIKICLPFY